MQIRYSAHSNSIVYLPFMSPFLSVILSFIPPFSQILYSSLEFLKQEIQQSMVYTVEFTTFQIQSSALRNKPEVTQESFVMLLDTFLSPSNTSDLLFL